MANLSPRPPRDQLAGYLILGTPDSPEQREFLGRLLRTCFTIGGLILVLFALVPTLAGDPRASEVQRVPLLAIGIGVFLLVPLLSPDLVVKVGPRLWPPTVGFLVVMSALLPLLLGDSFGPLASAASVWIAGASLTFLPPRLAWWFIGAGLASWAAAMAVLAGPDTFGRVLVVVIVTVVNGWVYQRMLHRLIASSERERAATASAEEATAALAVASAQKSAFLARVSHELRTPLNAVLGFAGLLKRGDGGPLDAKQADYVDEVVSSGEHLLALVDDVLHLSRVEAGDDSVSLRPLDVAALVERSAALFRDQAARSRVRLVVDVAPGTTLVADERKLRQVVFNLVSNAVRFTPEHGEVCVTLRSGEAGAELEVRDSGVGIDPADHERIFEPYVQAHGGVGGTGLGLSVARHFVRLHGGTLTVHSRRGAGAIFTARFPVDRSANTAEGRSRSDAGERDLVASVREWLLADIAGAVCLGATALLGALVAIAPPAAGALAGAGVVAVILLAAVVGVLLLRAGRGRPAGVRGAVTLVSVLAVAASLAVVSAGSLGSAVSSIYVWVVLGAVVLLPRRPALLVGGLALGGLAAAAAVSPGWSTPALRVGVVCGMYALYAATVMPLVERMGEIARSEALARAEAERAEAATLAATRHKSEFVATMSHELRTPLNAIIGFSEALRGEVFGPITATQADYLDEILVSGRHLLALINDVLDLAKLEAGRMAPPTVEVQVEDLAEDVLGELGRRDPVPTAFDVDDGLPAVLADRAALVRAMSDMVRWVALRTPSGDRTVRLALLASEGGVAITASCPASSRVDVADAFGEFSSGRGPGTGTGLGMALVRRQIDRHGGWCQAEATAGIVAVTAWLPACGVATTSVAVP